MRYFERFLVVLSVLWIKCASAEQGFAIGCYEASNSNQSNHHRVRTVDECLDLCEKSFFEIAAISNVFCWCTESINAVELNDTECNIQCVGNAKQICGGPSSESYYQTGVEVAGPATNVRQVERSQTSITIKWDEPQQKKFLRNYIVRVNPIKTFAKSLLPGQWTVPKENKSSEGGVASVTIETEIGIPEPEPQQPTVLSRGDTSLVIEIKPQTNINGPISFYHVIVLYVDNGLVQQFDENLLTNFKQAQEDGTNYYITAELEYQDSVRRFTIGDGRYYRGYQNIALTPDSHVHVSIGIVSIMGNLTTRRYASTSHEQHDVMITIREDENNGQSDLVIVTLVVACIIFGLLLVCSIIAYFYLRIRLNHRLRRLPSDHHELTLQGPIIEVENNGYIPDDYLKGNFEQKLNDLLDRVPNAQKYPRNMLALDVNHIVGSGNYGDVIVGHLNRRRCQVHVVSDDMEPLDQMQFLKDFAQIQQISSHPNVLGFLGICQTPDWLYVMFEEATITLKKRLIDARVTPNFDPHRFSTLSEEFVLRLLAELSDAMDYLSMHQFVHRKLCSYNICLTSQDEIKISAFGATPFDDPTQSHRFTTLECTRSASFPTLFR
ncbi:hypothetical protein HA402_002932 [Bradysia odoriphaga]|nr:hypothetical protein HA402_002932 [Bradysia odoriphaga]